MKRRYFTIVIAGTMFVLALLLTLYPVISNLYNEQHQSVIHTAYEEVIQQADTGELDRIREQAQAYNEAITPGAVEGSYTQEALRAAAETYGSQLDPGGNGIMGYVEIPRIRVNLPIYHGTDAETLERGAGHLLGSSLPVGGESTHAIITGHSGLATQKMFTDLQQLREGDVFYLHVLDQVLAYQVFHTEAVLPHDTTRLGIAEGEDRCTLITCYPVGVNSHRLLVQGERIPYTEPEEGETAVPDQQEETVSSWEEQYMMGVWMGLAGMLALLLVVFILGMIRRRKARGNKPRGGRYARKHTKGGKYARKKKSWFR